MRRVLPALAALTLAVGGLAALPPVVETADAAPGDPCNELLTSGYCTITYADSPDGVVFTVPDPIQTITLLIAGASGGGGGSGFESSAQGGNGALIFGQLNLGSDRVFVVQPGDQGDGIGGGTGNGWSSGGTKGNGRGEYADGGGGGGSTAIAFESAGIGNPFAVAGGGGGGGGNVSDDGESASGGGLGGQGGGYDNDGDPGHKEYAQNGAGGSGSDASGPVGEGGGNATGGGFNTSVGGGGGGGGYSSGGGGGEEGFIATCNDKGHCPPNPFAGAGGGGGAGDSFDDGTLQRPGTVPPVMTAGYGPGSVTIFAGTPTVLDCIPTDEGQTFVIPDGVDKYAFIMAGGAGTRGHSADHLQGTGALVSGLMDVSGLDTLRYWVGCSGYNGGFGWGSPGHGGGASASTAKDGGDGGAASLILNGDTDDVDAIAAAGGGGGSGGDAACIPDTDDCVYTGGKGGSGAGMDDTRLPYHGQSGEGKFDSPSGGCSDCMMQGSDPDPDGGEGSHSDTGGGGGGGGAGFPKGGDGGNEKGDASGGGGGAGGSYVGTRVSNPSMTASGSPDNGFIILIPMMPLTTTLTVSKDVTGDAASYGTGPFTVEVTCSYDGNALYDQTAQLTPTTPHVFEGVPTNATCEVQETGTGGATVPAQTAVVTIGTTPEAVTLANEFDLADLDVGLESVVPDVGTTFGIGTLSVQVDCTFDGRALTLPDNGVLTYVGGDTWNAEVMHSLQVPVNSSCTATQAPVPGNPAITYSPQTITVEPGGSVLGVIDTYSLVPLDVTKATTGDGTPPFGALYDITAACEFAGGPVVLANDSAVVASGLTASIDNIPSGAACTLTEVNPQGAVSVLYQPSRTVTAGAVSEATVTNDYTEGGLHVSVHLTGAGASWVTAAMSVEITIECFEPGETDPYLTAVLGMPATGSVGTIAPNTGSTCELSETDSAGATDVSYPLGTTILIPDEGAASLEVDNRFDIAPLVVTSQNTGAGAQYANTASQATVDGCEFNGVANAYSQVIGFGIHGGSGVASGIVVGAECDVTQTVGTGAPATFAQTGGDPSSAITDGLRVTVNADGPTTVTITNDFALGALTVSKALTGAAVWAANAPYSVDVECTFNGLPVTRIGPNGIASLAFDAAGALQPGFGATALETLSDGTNCSAIESATGGGGVSYLPAGTGRSGDVETPGAIAITNDFPATTFAVSKVLGGNEQAAHVDDGFLFQTRCVFNGQTLGPAPGDVNPPAMVTLSGGETATYTLLPVGANCTATEAITNHATDVTPSVTQSGTLDADGLTVTFTNVFDVAPLQLRQVVTGDGAAAYGLPKVFLAKVECTYPDGYRLELPNDGFFPLNAGNSFAHDLSVPVGVTCSIDEQNDNHATEMVLSAPQTVELGDIALLEATTRFDLANLEVNTLAYGNLASTTDFDYTSLCTWPHPDPAKRDVIPPVDPVDDAFTQGNGDSRDIQVLMNSFCTVTEVGTGGALRVVVTTVGPRTSVLPDAADAELFAPGDAAFTFENYLQGSLPVTGGEASGLVAFAGVLLLLGAGLLVARRRTAR